MGEREWPYGESEGWTVLDQDHLIRPVVETTDGEDQPAGWIEAHRNSDGQWCVGSMFRRGARTGEGRAQWDVVSEDPLTLTPSVLCRKCGNHGFIRDGRWVAA